MSGDLTTLWWLCAFTGGLNDLPSRGGAGSRRERLS
jgi:hypothetical protein